MKTTTLSRRAGQCAALTQRAALIVALGIFAGASHAQTLGSNLALSGSGAGADGSGFSDTKLVRDGNSATYTQASGTSNQRVSVKWGSAINFNTVILRESGSKVTN